VAEKEKEKVQKDDGHNGREHNHPVTAATAIARRCLGQYDVQPFVERRYLVKRKSRERHCNEQPAGAQDFPQAVSYFNFRIEMEAQNGREADQQQDHS
jgi:hypothetical protein